MLRNAGHYFMSNKITNDYRYNIRSISNTGSACFKLNKYHSFNFLFFISNTLELYKLFKLNFFVSNFSLLCRFEISHETNPSQRKTVEE